MKKSISFLIMAAIAIIFGISSCNKEDNAKQNTDNDVLARYLQIKSKMSSFQKTNGDANLQALGASIMNHKKKSLKGDSDSGWVDTGWVNVDTTYWQQWTCAEVTESVDANGNFVTVYDYGQEGCDDWGSLIKGKITYIWSQNNEIYYSKVIYENYSAWGMTMNGFSEYTYSFGSMIYANGGTVYSSNGDSIYAPIKFTGSSSCSEDIEMIYEGGESYHYTADYSSEWDEKSSTIHQGEYSYKSITSGYEYTYKINQELYYNYECGYEIWVPVRGIEEIIYKDAETDSDFITDYGDGTCDNLATVTENGVSYTIDFGKLWIWEPCKDANCDSTVVMVNGK